LSSTFPATSNKREYARMSQGFLVNREESEQNIKNMVEIKAQNQERRIYLVSLINM